MKCCILPALTIALSLTAVDVKGDAAKNDLAALQGTWVAISGEVQGQKVNDAALRVFKIVIKGTRITFAGNRESTFELDTATSPRLIAVTPLDGPRKGKTQRAIYSVEKDILKLCMPGDPTKEGLPPREFTTRPGDGYTLVTFKRDTAARAGQ